MLLDIEKTEAIADVSVQSVIKPVVDIDLELRGDDRFRFACPVGFSSFF